MNGFSLWIKVGFILLNFS